MTIYWDKLYLCVWCLLAFGKTNWINVCRALRRHWRHWSKIELTINYSLSCYFCSSFVVFLHIELMVRRCVVCSSLWLSSASIVPNIFVSISQHINFICTYTLNYMMLKSLCVFVWWYFRCLPMCVCVCAQIRTSFEYETDSDIVAWANIRYVILHNLFEHCFVITQRYMYILNHTLHT